MQPIELYPGISSHQGILGGKPVITGTRVPVDLVLGQLASGMSEEQVSYEYHLTPEQIRAALGYAAKRLSEEVIYATHQ